MTSNRKHWDRIFGNTADSNLGWYEKNPDQTLELLDQIPEWKQSVIFLPGVGTSVLVEELLSRGASLVINDISAEALNRVKDRLRDNGKTVESLCRDISQPITKTLPDIGIWIDRAVLHFLTEEDDIVGYFNNVKSILRTGGHAIFAEFSKTGAEKCAGLTLHRYSIEELEERLGPAFKLISHFDYTYINPNGDPRPYIYTLFKREK